MAYGWENHEPSPIEFMHQEILNAFHEFRLSKTTDTIVQVDGMDITKMIAKAKKSTYKKYKPLQLDKPVLKNELLKKEGEIIEKYICECVDTDITTDSNGINYCTSCGLEKELLRKP